MQDPNESAVEQLRQITKQLSDGGTKNTRSLREKYAAVVGAVLTEPSVVLSEINPDLQALPAGVAGMAMCDVYDRLDEERKRSLWAWVSQLEEERRDMERTCAIPAVLASDPATAFSILFEMRTTKDQRERLGSVLRDVSVQMISALFSGEQEQVEYKVRRVVQLLALVAVETKAIKARTAVLAGILPAITRLSLQKGSIGDKLREHLEALEKLVDEPYRSQLADLLRPVQPCGSSDDISLPTVEPETPPVSPAAAHALPELENSEPADCCLTYSSPVGIPEHPTEKSPPDLGQEDPLAWFDTCLQMLSRVRECYLAARNDLAAERRHREKAEARVSEQTQLVEALKAAESRIREEWTAKLRSATEAMESERRLRESVECELSQQAQLLEQERKAFQKRIDSNAEARLHDLRVGLRNEITPLLAGVPAPGSPRAAELGPNLAIALDQIIDVLDNHGVGLRQAVREAR